MSNRSLPIILTAIILTMVGCNGGTTPPVPQPPVGSETPNLVGGTGTSAGVQTMADLVNNIHQLTAAGDTPQPAQNTDVAKVSGGPAPIAAVVFFDRHEPTEGNNDIYIQEVADGATAAVVDVNTPDNEINPSLARQGTWIVFQRTVHSIPDPVKLVPFPTISAGPAPRPQQDIFLYDLVTGSLRSLPNLNTEEYDEYAPAICDDGHLIVYLTNQSGYPQVRLYDVEKGQSYEVPGANRSFKDVTWPTISGDGKIVAFGASEQPGEGVAVDETGNPTGGAAFTGGALTPAQSDIYIYDIAHGVQLTPPTLNTPFDEYEPALSPDGQAMLFVTNRYGSEDILEVNLATAAIDDLPRLNTRGYDEQHPLYEDNQFRDILYQIKPIDKILEPDMQLHHRPSRLVERLILPGAKRAPRPELRALPGAFPSLSSSP
jgi:Tol biopolymer transport system component